MPQVAAMGAAVAVGDFDRDGWQDLYVTNSAEGSLNRLYRNKGDGTFIDVAAADGRGRRQSRGHRRFDGRALGRLRQRRVRGSVPLQVRPARALPQRRRTGASSASPSAPGLPAWVNANAAIWWDYDADGWLDLFLSGYWAEDIDLWHLKTTRIMPESFEYAENGGRKYVFRNRGDGTFEETSAALGIQSRRWTLAAAAADLSGTGYPDLFLANDYGVSQLYVNQGGKRFVEVGRETGVGRTPKSGMNASFGDIFNDGRLSIYKTNISEPGVLVQANDLWVPKARAAGAALEFENLASTHGRRSRRLELGRAVRRSEQRRHARHVSRQRLRLGRRAHQLLVRLRGDCRRPQPHHRRRQQLAADARTEPVGLSAQARLDQRWRRPLHGGRAGRRRDATPTTAARSRWRICRTAACST